MLDTCRLIADVLPGNSPARRQCEESLAAAGSQLPLPHRLAWDGLESEAGSRFLRIRDPEENCLYGCAVNASKSRAIPGHSILRVRRFDAGGDPEVARAAVEALAGFARAEPRVLRLHVELFSRVPEIHRAMDEFCPSCGFTKLGSPRSYRDTAVLDLSPSLEQIFASLHATGRRHIRAVAKNPVRIRSIEDGAYGERMEELMKETFGRTDATPAHWDWGRLIDFSNRHPTSARVVGLFRQPWTDGPESLLSFAVGYNHGDHVEYADAASTRNTDLKMPLAYGLAWDLIAWAKALGATWFDFSGITHGDHDDPGDRLRGISDFKRYFTKDVVHVGDEWVLEPHALRARAARAIGTIAARIRGVVRPIGG